MSVTITDWIPVLVVSLVGFFVAFPRVNIRMTWLLHLKVGDILASVFPFRPRSSMRTFSAHSWREFMSLSVGEIMSTILFLVFLAIRYAEYYHRLSNKDKPVRAVAMRALGELNFVLLGFLLLPVSKHSIWLHLLGISFERAIKFHRAWAVLTVSIMGIHGFGMWIEYANSMTVPFSEVLWFKTNPATGWSNLSGLIAFLFALMMLIMARPFVRRKFYEVFYRIHVLCAPLVYIFAGLHMPLLLNWMVPSLALYGLDFGVRWWKRCLHDARIIDKRTIVLDADKSTVTALTVQIAPNLLHGQPLRYLPGQFFTMVIPAISWWECHPFSASQPAKLVPATAVATSTKQHATLLHFHIKSMGENTWTHKLAKCSTDILDRVYLDGPFGRPFIALEEYERLIFICGGKVYVAPSFQAHHRLFILIMIITPYYNI